MLNFARSFLIVGLTTAALLSCVPMASADLNLTYGQGSTLLGNGPAPTQAGDYVTVNFVRNSATQVKMTINVTNAVPNARIDQIGFNFNFAATSFDYSSGVVAVSSNYNNSGISLLGSGNTKFNTVFDYPPPSIQGGGPMPYLNNANGPSVYTINFANGTSLNNDLSNLLTLTGPSSYASALHLTAYTVNGNDASAALVNKGSSFNPQSELPEPSALALGLLGSVFVCALNGCRRVRAKLAGTTAV